MSSSPSIPVTAPAAAAGLNDTPKKKRGRPSKKSVDERQKTIEDKAVDPSFASYCAEIAALADDPERQKDQKRTQAMADSMGRLLDRLDESISKKARTEENASDLAPAFKVGDRVSSRPIEGPKSGEWLYGVIKKLIDDRCASVLWDGHSSNSLWSIGSLHKIDTPKLAPAAAAVSSFAVPFDPQPCASCGLVTESYGIPSCCKKAHCFECVNANVWKCPSCEPIKTAPASAASSIQVDESRMTPAAWTELFLYRAEQKAKQQQKQ